MGTELSMKDIKTILSAITTAAVVGMAVFVQQVKTDVAVMKKDIAFLIARDVVTKAQLELALTTLPYPWRADRESVLRRIRRLERKAGIEEGD